MATYNGKNVTTLDGFYAAQNAGQYYTKQNGITYRDYTGSGDALDQEAWYAAQDANYVSKAKEESQKSYTAPDPFAKFLTEYYLPDIQKKMNAETKGSAEYQKYLDKYNKTIWFSTYLSKAQKTGDSFWERQAAKLGSKESIYSDWDSMYGADNSSGKILTEYTKQISAEMDAWYAQHDFYNRVVTQNTKYETILAKEAAEEQKKQQTIQAENEAKLAARKNGHQTQSEVFKDTAELLYGSKDDGEETTGSGITSGVAGSGLTMQGTNVTGGSLGANSSTANNPVTRREKARKGLLGGAA